MSRLALPDQIPLHVLFPEEYARSKSMIVKDFAFFGACIVSTVLIFATILNLG